MAFHQRDSIYGLGKRPNPFHAYRILVFEAHWPVRARIALQRGGDAMLGDAMLNDEKLNRLCRSCGHAFSQFLHEMAEHNSKIAGCPRCGKPHHFKHPKSDKPVVAQLRARKILTNL
jgi:hypothetical protein